MDKFYSPESSVSKSGAHLVALNRELHSTATAPSREEHVRVVERAQPTGGQRMAWLLSMFAFLLLLSFFLPFTVEKMSYALARGRQLAEYETAGEQLKNVALTDLSKAYQLVANRVSPSVVHINVVSNLAPDTAKLMEFTFQRSHPHADQGSGVIIDADGHVLTNHHVVANAADIRVKLSDGRRCSAQVIGADPLTDLAVLKISERGLTPTGLIPAEWGDSDDLRVGALVWAMGSPFGLESSVTFGILSAKHRSEKAGTYYQDFLQTDAAVNPGNSGGPLVNSHGRVVGINTAIVGDSYQGIGFAIPSTVAKTVYDRIRSTGRVQRGWLGVQPREVSDDDLRDFELPSKAGAFIFKVVPDSPAHAAGIRLNDVIVQWGDQLIEEWSDLYTQVAATPVGTPVAVTVVRDGEPKALTVVVNERQEDG